MTSKKCSNGALVKENLRRFWWIAALYFIALFFAIPFRLLVSLQSIENELVWAAEEAARQGVRVSDVYTYDLFNFTGGAEAVAFFIIPVFIAGLLYSYMNKRKSMDTIHALPIKRMKLFSLNALSGVVLYTLPLVITCIISAIIITSAGLWPYIPAWQMLLWFVQSMLSLSVFFAIACFFSVLAGNVLVMAILTYIFSSLPMIFYGAVTGTASIWMYGFSTPSDMPLLMDITPSFYVFRSAVDMIDPEKAPLIAVGYLIFAVVMYLLACLLYQNRRSENTTSTIAFGAAKPIIKYILSILFAILFGSIIYLLGGANNIVNLIVGYLVGAAIAYLIIHAVIHKDIRAIKTGKRGLIILLVVIFAGSMALMFDAGGYQRRVPDPDDVSAIYFDPMGYRNCGPEYGTGYKTPENKELIRKIHQSCVDAKFGSNYSFTTGRTEVPPLYFKTPDTPEKYTEGEYYYTLNTDIKYDLGGRELTRNYSLTPEAFETYLPRLLASEEGKRNTFAILNEEMFVYPDNLTISDVYGNAHLIKDRGQIKLIIDALKADVLADETPFSTELQKPSIGSLEFVALLVDKNGEVVSNGDCDVYDYAYLSDYTVDSASTSYTVKPYYSNTIAAAAACGAELAPMDTADISTIRLYPNIDAFTPLSGEWTDKDYEEDHSIIITDPAEIAAVYGAMRESARLGAYFEPSFYQCEVVTHNGNAANTLYYEVDVSALPDFVFERMGVINPSLN
ncbi:MAG: hypothetical protein IKD89_05475 [Clostridia bacterium]|nr:hypothetical protein [Clostridia bacterium]